jgi:hypothetical protein
MCAGALLKHNATGGEEFVLLLLTAVSAAVVVK